jgi:hypothetical protein
MIDLSKITTLDEVVFKGTPSEFFQKVADKFENNVATDFEIWADKWEFEMSEKEEMALRFMYQIYKFKGWLK